MVSLTSRFVIGGMESVITIYRGGKGDNFDPSKYDLSAYEVCDVGFDSNTSASDFVAGMNSNWSDGAG